MVKCPKCDQQLRPVFLGLTHDFLIGGYCLKCQKLYPLAEADCQSEWLRKSGKTSQEGIHPKNSVSPERE